MLLLPVLIPTVLVPAANALVTTRFAEPLTPVPPPEYA
jgi:hypothetical protein